MTARATVHEPQVSESANGSSPPVQRVADPRVLGDRYLVLETLGRGAVGVVYRAYDKAVGREVAVKVLQTKNTEAQARLIAEARAMAQLSNPHVVAVYDVVSVESQRAGGRSGRVLLVMQYVQGTTLEQWCSVERPPEAILEVFHQAGRGLYAAHCAGIVHRDFKPANVLVSHDGRALVTDFGIAGRDARLESSAGAVDRPQPASEIPIHERGVGTPWYMSPEQHLGLLLDARSDQYAFCVALWEALTGEPLFTGATNIAELVVQKHEPLHAWPKPEDAVAAAVVAAIYRGLSLNPDDRFPSMADLLAALQTEPPASRVFTRAAVATAMVIGGGFAWSWYDYQAQRCSSAEERLRGIWDAGKRLEVREALLATQLGYAADTADRVEHELDGFAEAWVREHRAACEATTIRAEQPPHVMDLRMACLHRVAVELRAATSLLTHIDAQLAQRAQRVIGALPSPTRCSDVAALQNETIEPDVDDVAAVENARARLAEVAVLRAAGKFAEARAAVLAVAEDTADLDFVPLRTELLVAVSLAHQDMGAYEESESWLKRALRSALEGRQWPAAQRAAAGLVTVVGALQMRAAEGLSYAAVADALLVHGDPGAGAELHIGLGKLLARQHRSSEAEAEFRRALQVMEEAEELDELELAEVHSNLGNVFFGDGRYAQAEQEHRAVLQLRMARLGSEHPDVAASRINLANALALQGRHEEAAREHHAALNLSLKVLGPDDHLVAVCRNNLANAAGLRGDWATAEEQGRAALELLLRLHGPEHLEVAMTRNNLGYVLAQLGRHEEAAAEHRAVLALTIKLLGPDHPDVAISLNALGIALLESGQYAEAESTLRSALEVRKKVLPDLHLDIADTRYELARALTGQGRHREAELEHRATLAIREHFLEPDHADVARSRSRLAHVLAKQGRLDEAEALYGAALAVQERLFGRHDPNTVETREGLARVRRSARRR